MTQKEAIDHICRKYAVTIREKSYTFIPNMGRNDLAVLFYELGYRSGAEIGVEEGRYSEVLCKANPRLTLYCVDPWVVYPGYRSYFDQKKVDEYYSSAVQRLAGTGCIFIKAFSMEAVKRFGDRSIDFVFIDANHSFISVVEDIYYWSQKVRSGGIIAGHDYIRRRKPTSTHVIQAVNGFTDAYRIHPWFVTGHREKIESMERDDSHSWFWLVP